MRRRLARRRAQIAPMISAPSTVVAAEADEAVAFAAGRRLADVVEEGAEAQRRAAAHLVGERLGQQRLDLGGALAGEALEVGLDLERVLEHGERVAVDVEVVVGALLDAAQVLQLGQDDGGQLELVEQGEAAQRVGTAEQLAQLGQLALAGGLGGARGARRGRGATVAGSISRPSSAASRAARSSRSGSALEAALADRAQDAALEVGEAAERVERLARRPSGTATAPIVKSRSARSASIPSPRSAVTSTCQPREARGDPPGAELGRELEGVLAELGGDRPRARRRVAGDGEVEVGDLAAQRRVAHRAADDPDALGSPAERAAPRRRPAARARGCARRRGSTRHAARRGTRAEIPQVTS